MLWAAVSSRAVAAPRPDRAMEKTELLMVKLLAARWF
jgi:hypothetical protein